MNNLQMEQIIDAVLERINQEDHLTKDTILVLFGESVHDIREGIRQIRLLKEKGYVIRCVYTPKMLEALEKWKASGKIEWYPEADFTEADYYRTEEILEHTDIVVIPTWSLGFITEVLNGYENNMVQTFMQEIWQSETVTYVADQETHYKKRIHSQTEMLRQAGMRIIPLRRLAEVIINEPVKVEEAKEKEVQKFTGKIFCREDLEKINTGAVIIEKHTLVSPEAMDFAKKRGIEIVKEKEDYE